MSEWNEITGGQRIELGVSIAGVATQFSSTIAEKSADSFMVAMPTSQQAEKLLRTDAVVSVTVYGKNSIYKFNTRIRERKLIRGQMLILDRPAAVEKVKPRSYYRLAVQAPLQFRIMRDEVTPISEFKQATTQDISGGGLMIETKTPIQKDTLIEINLKLPGGDDPVNAIARVGFVKTERRGHDEITLAGAEFSIIEEKYRDRIIKFIMDVQRNLVKRGIMR
ncbi:MAG: flagellar brake protein [bacterium]